MTFKNLITEVVMTVSPIFITLIVSAIGGSIGSLLTIWSTHRLAKRKIKINQLEEKIYKLYGPLSFHLLYMNACFRQFFSVLEGACKYSNDVNLMDSDDKAEACAVLMEHYHTRLDELHEDVFHLISKNYSLIDNNDTEFMDNYIESTLLHSVEIRKSNTTDKLPEQVTRLLNQNKDSLYDFSEYISKKVNTLKLELQNLRG